MLREFFWGCLRWEVSGCVVKPVWHVTYNVYTTSDRGNYMKASWLQLSYYIQYQSDINARGESNEAAQYCKPLAAIWHVVLAVLMKN